MAKHQTLWNALYDCGNGQRIDDEEDEAEERDDGEQQDENTPTPAHI